MNFKKINYNKRKDEDSCVPSIKLFSIRLILHLIYQHRIKFQMTVRIIVEL